MSNRLQVLISAVIHSAHAVIQASPWENVAVCQLLLAEVLTDRLF